MNMPHFEVGADRAAVREWRDAAALTAIAALHAASRCAMQSLEEQMQSIVGLSSVVRTEAFARDMIGSIMRAQVVPMADDWFNDHARALRQIDPRLEKLALRFALIRDRPALPQDEVIAPTGWIAPAWLRRASGTVGSVTSRRSLEDATSVFPEALRQGAEQAMTRLGRELGERAGLYERLRMAARAELSRVWLGPALTAPSPRPYLAQLLDTVDRTSDEAMEIIA